jgi:extracellular factor (EF) 3-hydroxypalmitic acid methyl ester biosynthesis protein
MQNYFMDLRRWLEQVELGIRSYPSGKHTTIEREVIDELALNILPPINSLFARFEGIAEHVAPDLLPFHRSYLRRQLHPQLLCSPFAYRTYRKPLGYAGDYEMVNMIMRDPHEGSSIFAKMMNLWFLSQAPATAHRNRIEYLSHHLTEETRRVSSEGRLAQIFNLGCGPAWEIQNFLVAQDLCDKAHFTLLDFNDDTLLHTSKILEDLRTQYRRHTPIKMVKKSVHVILKEAARPGEDLSSKYDLIYCAGLFDYLSDRICQRLMDTFYAMLAPGGLLLATNVDTSNPIRNMMEYVLDWHLIYRDAQQMSTLRPREADPTRVKVQSDPTGVNTFLEVRKAPS